MSTKTVKIGIREIGQSFAVCADIRDVATQEVLYTTIPRPVGFGASAQGDAESVAAMRGWSVIS